MAGFQLRAQILSVLLTNLRIIGRDAHGLRNGLARAIEVRLHEVGFGEIEERFDPLWTYAQAMVVAIYGLCPVALAEINHA